MPFIEILGEQGSNTRMALDSVGELLEIAGRFLFRILNEALVEFLCKGTGYWICKPFKSNLDRDGFLVFVVGFIFWVGAIILCFHLYEFIQIDKCLDSGGSFDYTSNKCLE